MGPLFWRPTDAGLAFASELPALAQHAGLPPLDLDPVGLQKFFAYALFPGVSSPYRGVEKLPAGNSLTLDLAEVSFIDADGVALFRELLARGAAISHASLFVAQQLKEVGHAHS